MTKPIRIDGDVAYVPLTKGHVAIIDAADANFIGLWNWHAHVCRTGIYAVHKDRRDGRKKNVYLHRALLNPPDGVEVDHINCDGRDNRRSNIRFASHPENMWNLRPHLHGRLKGCFFNKRDKRWQAQITIAGKRLYLGYFDTEAEAHAAYADAARLHHGRFSRVA